MPEDPIATWARAVVAASATADEAFRQAKGYAQGRQDERYGDRDVHAVLEFAGLYRAMVFSCELGRRRNRVLLKEAYDAWAAGHRF